MWKIKTVFKEEIEIGDKIMYIYKAAGVTHICFGEVLNVGYKKVQFHKQEQPYLQVRKTYEIKDGRLNEPCDRKVTLTSPLAFKCNQNLPFLQ